MHKWTVRAARVALVAAAISAAGAGVANADHTSGDYSILGGNQFRIPIIAPIGLFGNHVNVLSSMVPSGYRFSHVAMDNDTDAQPQMDICGNAIAGNNGVGTAACKGEAGIGGAPEAAPVAHTWAAPADDSNTIGAPSSNVGAPGSPIGAAPAVAPAAAQIEAPAAAPAAPVEAPAVTPADAPAAAPVDVPAAAPAEAPAMPPADAAPVDAPAAAPVEAPAMPPAAAPIAAPVEAPAAPPVAGPVEAPIAAPVEPPVMAPPVHEMSTSGDNSIAGGNQIKAPVRMPIRVCGNAAALGGMATAACEGRASTGRFGAHHAFRTLGLAGLLG